MNSREVRIKLGFESIFLGLLLSRRHFVDIRKNYTETSTFATVGGEEHQHRAPPQALPSPKPVKVCERVCGVTTLFSLHVCPRAHSKSGFGTSISCCGNYFNAPRTAPRYSCGAQPAAALQSRLSTRNATFRLISSIRFRGAERAPRPPRSKLDGGSPGCNCKKRKICCVSDRMRPRRQQRDSRFEEFILR